jgi:predicted lipoprotein with Yx(FWY)xxD motif
MRNLMLRRIGRCSAARWASSAALVVAMAGTVVAAGPALASAHTVVAPAAHSRSAVVVKERARMTFGKILVTPKGRALYVLPRRTCRNKCLSVWPRLVMPKGKTRPKGATCLATARFGANHRQQVTYRKMRLYTFTGDRGTSVNGNGVAGFRVARVVKCK